MEYLLVTIEFAPTLYKIKDSSVFWSTFDSVSEVIHSDDYLEYLEKIPTEDRDFTIEGKVHFHTAQY